jgi:hypothetical protein
MLSSFDARPVVVPGAFPIERERSSASAEEPHKKTKKASAHARMPTTPAQRPRSPLSPASSRSSRSNVSVRAPVAAVPLRQTISGSSDAGSSASYTVTRPLPAPQTPVSGSSDALDIRELTRVEELDQFQEHYATAYAPQELRTFHCDRVRKMPLSGLDPSMLIGFLCRDEADWKDLRSRLVDVSHNTPVALEKTLTEFTYRWQRRTRQSSRFRTNHRAGLATTIRTWASSLSPSQMSRMRARMLFLLLIRWNLLLLVVTTMIQIVPKSSWIQPLVLFRLLLVHPPALLSMILTTMRAVVLTRLHPARGEVRLDSQM